ncbi:hypothetical protein NDU88_003098 [Pleurodeles waltl]|uniref:Uncharacterized protein n=1 Tax=Pleurodeles waltl TaxID=8319 RepID=A0AAV7KXH8_PLEWA|nr:hypothetical protein NDU88_003098 [Pleurodeles waltl]
MTIWRAVHSQGCRVPLELTRSRLSHTTAAATLFTARRLQHPPWSRGGTRLAADGAQENKDSPNGTGEAQSGGQCRQER